MNDLIKLILLLALLVQEPLLFAAEPATTPHVTVGAIRWDAWHGDASDIGFAVQKSLSPKHWRSRLPFFSEVSHDGTVAIRGDTDEVMRRELS